MQKEDGWASNVLYIDFPSLSILSIGQSTWHMITLRLKGLKLAAMAFCSTQYASGVACICFVAVLWTFATVLKQLIFSDLNYNEPLVLTYVCNACYAVHFPLHGLLRMTKVVSPIPWRRAEAEGSVKNGEVREAMRGGLIIAPLWFAAQWTYSAGVASTSVTASTVISTTSVVWTLLASILFLKEKVTVVKASKTMPKTQNAK